MTAIGNEIEEIGKDAMKRDLFQNLLYWTTWEFKIPYSSSKFYFKGDISSVFNRRYNYASISTSSGLCPLLPDCSYDISTSTFSVSYDYTEYVANGCDAILDPLEMGYLDYTDSSFETKVDMRSYMIAAAVRL